MSQKFKHRFENPFVCGLLVSMASVLSGVAACGTNTGTGGSPAPSAAAGAQSAMTVGGSASAGVQASGGSAEVVAPELGGAGGAAPVTSTSGGALPQGGAAGNSAGGASSAAGRSNASGGAAAASGGISGVGGAPHAGAAGASATCHPGAAHTHNLNNDNWAGALTLFISYSADTRSQTVDKGYTSAQWNAAVDSFDVPSFAAQVANTGAKNILLMLGQNTGYYNSPNDAYEQYAGAAKGSKCSVRDLPMEIADALAGKGIGMYLYLPEDVGWGDTTAANNFGLSALAVANWVVDSKFTPKWNAVIKTWADRYGSKVKGWFFDGYEARWGVTQTMAETYRATCLAANPCGVVTFNGTGSNPISDTQRGETRIDTTTGLPAKGLPTSRWDKSDLQVMWDFPLQAAWGQEIEDNSPAIYQNAKLAQFIAAGQKAQAVYALDCRTSMAGVLSKPIYDQLVAIKQ